MIHGDEMGELIEERAGRVVAITLNRPEARNAFSQQMMRDLIAWFDRLSRDDGVGAIVLRGAGKSFCAGGDIKGWEDRGNWSYERQYKEMRWKQELPLAMKRCSKVIVAALHGHVIGAGFSLALAADFRIAASDTVFATNFASVGFAGDFGVNASLMRLIGPARARELMILNERMSARQAQELGLLTKVVEVGDFDAEVASFAERIALGPTVAWSYMKRNLLAAESEPFAKVLDVEAMSQARCAQTEDHREAIAAFLARRKPEFRGR